MKIKRILLAVDFSEKTEDIIGKVFARMKCEGAELFIIHVVQDISRVSLYSDAYALWEQYRDRACKDTLMRLNDYIKALSAVFNDIQPIVEVGDPADVIAGQAEKLGADLIVVGNHCRQGLQHMLHRNVSEKVMRLARREVISFYTGEC